MKTLFKKEKVAFLEATFLIINCLDKALKLFPLPLYPCSKVYLHASERGGTSVLHRLSGILLIADRQLCSEFCACLFLCLTVYV